MDKTKEKVIKQKRWKRKKLNVKRATMLTLFFGLISAYVVYSEVNKGDGFTRDEAYEIKNIAVEVKVDDKYSSEILTSSVDLLVYGDEDKVANMKSKNTVPKVVIDLTGKNAGIYDVQPYVDGELINVNYEFTPGKVDVEVIEAVYENYKVIENAYDLASEGFYIEKLVAKEDAILKVTEANKLEIGNVVVEIDASSVTQSGIYQAEIVVLDKRGNVLNIGSKKPTIDVEVTYSPLSWKTITEEIATLEEEISVLNSELETKTKELGEVQDVLRKTDLQKEVDFRTTRLAEKTQTLEEKKTSLVGLKDKQETEKKDSVRKSVKDGGKIVTE